MVGCTESALICVLSRAQEVLSWRYPLLSGLPSSAIPGSFPAPLAAADPEVAAAIDGRASPPAVADRADRQREHRLARGARGARLGPDEQICRRLSRTALLRRLRVRRCRRAAGDRARHAAVRVRLRQCAAACRGAGQPGGVSGAAEARRHGSRHVARRRRASDARRRAEPVGQVVSRGPLRRARRGCADRFRRRSSVWPRSTGRG